MKANKGRLYNRLFKRHLDIFLSLMGLLILGPVMLIVAIFVWAKIGRPILFKQDRPGLNEGIFTMYKFRTMTNRLGENGQLLPDSLRLTKLGKFLRSTSLDELPELINVLKGDMSIVGPRPLLVQYLQLYDENQRRRHEVRPGLTGLAQINGRNLLDWEDRFNLDIQYVDNVSFIGDCKIILKTMKLVLLRKGVSSATSVTMEPFNGKNEGLKL